MNELITSDQLAEELGVKLKLCDFGEPKLARVIPVAQNGLSSLITLFGTTE